MMISVSVIICTHNPRPEYLKRVLAALEAQTLSKQQWELLLVDNASDQPLAQRWDLSWHPHATHIREDELGLTPARMRGIRSSCGNLLVFVDDDNVLDVTYLQTCDQISKEFTFLGVWGGEQIGEFEIAVPDFMRPYLGNLACRRVSMRTWANFPFCYEATPVGAGMCIRSEIAAAYVNMTNSSSMAKGLDRVGSQLTCCGDLDLAFTACDCGFGMGLFPSLSLLHLIPKFRLERGYLLRLIEGDAYSNTLLKHRRGVLQLGGTNEGLAARARRIMRRLARRARGDELVIQVEDARDRGTKKAIEEIRKQTG